MDTTGTPREGKGGIAYPPVVKRLMDRGASPDEIYAYLREHVGFSHEKASQIVAQTRKE